jgi:hypothetical protein
VFLETVDITHAAPKSPASRRERPHRPETAVAAEGLVSMRQPAGGQPGAVVGAQDRTGQGYAGPRVCLAITRAHYGVAVVAHEARAGRRRPARAHHKVQEFRN